MADQTRNLNPTPPAVIAMIIWVQEYANKGGGSMDFWDSLSPTRQKRCEIAAEALGKMQDPNLTFKQFQQINDDRSNEWQGDNEDRSLADFGNDLAGETGELCNFLKKIRRIERGCTLRASEEDINQLIISASLEISDVIIQAFMLASELNLDVETILQTKFNITSKEFGFNQRI